MSTPRRHSPLRLKPARRSHRLRAAAVLALLGSSYGCSEADPCYFPEDYGGCVEMSRFAGCPNFGPLLVGSRPNVPPTYGCEQGSGQDSEGIEDCNQGGDS
ncbi:MAG: hypothetical protein K0V04_02925, partial [Deltaproteobacteria bacterium]|nr:hypothetical protein [Deltaproteobacteria bacterium]